MSLRIVAVLFVALASCREGSPPRSQADVLVLEVGGDCASLRGSLVAAGVPVDAAHRLRPMPAEAEPAVVPRPDQPRADPEPVVPAPHAEPPMPPQPPAEPDFFVVQLERGQTLIHLASKYLGKGTRYRELLALNGWTDADARRLREGQKVKIPRQPDGSSSR